MAKFGQFTDEWLQDKLLFMYLTDGSCSCCSLSVNFNTRLRELMSQCSDFDSDDARSSANSPWPQYIKESVWKGAIAGGIPLLTRSCATDRVLFRKSLKAPQTKYAQFWKENASNFTTFFNGLPLQTRRSYCQVCNKPHVRSMSSRRSAWRTCTR